MMGLQNIVFIMICVTIGLYLCNCAMFEITDELLKADNGETVLLKHIQNTMTNESCKIVVTPGGKLEEIALFSKNHNQVIQVILGHNGNATDILENPFYKGFYLYFCFFCSMFAKITQTHKQQI